MNGEGTASSVLAAIAAKTNKKHQPETNKKDNANQQYQKILQTTTPLLNEQINNINNMSITTNAESNCCSTCTIL